MTPTPPVAPNSPPTSEPRPLVPPEERFWKRYSPHHEFSLSNVTTLCLYALLLLVLFAIFYKQLFGDNELPPEKKPVDVEPLALAPGGGGGGEGGQGGKGEDLNPEENLFGTDGSQRETNRKIVMRDLPNVPQNPADFPDLADDEEGIRLVKSGNQPVQAIGGLQEGPRRELMKGLRGAPGPVGSGVGPGTDQGKILSQRKKRLLRWTMNFDTTSGDDYARQLAALEAIIAVPEKEGDEVRYRVYEDLRARPARGEVKDLSTIKRIFWIDNRKESVEPLVQALGIRSNPELVVAFFPEKVEADLLQKELKFRGLKEDEIEETRFRVLRTRTGYTPQVYYQRKKGEQERR